MHGGISILELTTPRQPLTASASLIALVGMAPVGLAATFQGLGDLPGGGTQSIALGVSDDGMRVSGWSLSTHSNQSRRSEEAFLWTRSGGLIGLGDLPGGKIESQAYAISANGLAVVGHSNSDLGGANYRSDEAFVWTPDDGMVGLGDLPGGAIASYARGVSADGSTAVGWSRSSQGDEAFRWRRSEGMVGLGDLPGGAYRSMARDVSANGEVVVGFSRSGFGEAGVDGNEAFVWTALDGMQGLGDLPGGPKASTAIAVSADGTVVVGSSVSGLDDESLVIREGFVWTDESGMRGLGDLPGGNNTSEALGVSGNGSVIVGVGSDANGLQAVLWDSARTIRPIKQILIDAGLEEAVDGWNLITAWDASYDGNTIVGYGSNPSGVTEAWVATLGDDEVPGDYNASGFVDQNDLDLVLQNWGQDSTNDVPAGWANDLPVGMIDQDELDGVLQNWGSTFVPNFRGTSVPESSALVLVAVALLHRRARGCTPSPRTA